MRCQCNACKAVLSDVAHSIENRGGPSGHVITLDGSTVCRDGSAVMVTGNKKTGDLQVGCTSITREALFRLCAFSDKCFKSSDTEILQNGYR